MKFCKNEPFGLEWVDISYKYNSTYSNGTIESSAQNKWWRLNLNVCLVKSSFPKPRQYGMKKDKYLDYHLLYYLILL